MSRFAGAWFVARKDLQYLIRSKETILWVFIMPVAFCYLIGSMTGGFAGGDDEPDYVGVVAAGEPGFLYDQLARRLEEQDLVPVAVEAAEQGEYWRRLTVPADMTARLLAGESVELEFVRRGGGLATDFDEIRVQRAVYTTLADLVALAQEGPVTEGALTALNETPRALTLEVAPAGERQRIPTGFEQAVPGIMVMFTLLVMLSSGAVLLVIERREGLLRRLAATPIPRSSVVLGKWGGKLVVGLVQIVFVMLLGRFMFSIEWGPQLPMVLLVLLVYAALVSALGVLLGSLARTEGQAIGFGVLGTNVLAALGGCWWPIEVTPLWMQKFSLVLPTGMTMDAIHRLVSFGRPAASALPHLAALAALGLVAGWLATRFFRYE